jgi:hypothetical protein
LAEALHGRRYDAGRSVRLSQITGLDEGFHRQPRRQFGKLISRASNQRQPHPLRCKRLCNRSADSSAGARDDGDFAVKLQIHR